MNPADEDRLLLPLILDSAEGRRELDRVRRMLDDDIGRGRFNRERAQQLFLFALDNCVHRYFKSLGADAAVLFPKEIRPPFANELSEEFVRSRGNIESQRPARHGLLSYIIGK